MMRAQLFTIRRLIKVPNMLVRGSIPEENTVGGMTVSLGRSLTRFSCVD
jgi:hypothetical protein